MSLKAPFGIKKDKWIHVTVGLMMGTWLIPSFSLNLGFVGWIICLGVAYVMKEVIYDKILKKGNYEIMDAVYTMFVPTILLIVYIIDKL